MDLSVDPCDNFYDYTCGHWSDEYINHGWYPSFSSFEIISEKLETASLKFLKSNASEDDPVPVKQSRLFYRACMDTDTLKRLGFSVMFKYLKQAELPMVPRFFEKPSDTSGFHFDWMQADVNLKRLLDMDLFVGFLVDANIYNRTMNVMYIGRPSASSPLPR